MLASVVIPCFNAAGTLAMQLEAFTRQRVDFAWELIVVDNHCTDETVAIAESFRERLPALRIERPAEHRPSALLSLGHGLSVARGQLLLLCDSDDEVADDWLATMVRALQTHDIVGGRLAHDRLNEPWLRRALGDGPQSRGFDVLDVWDGQREQPLPFSIGCNLGFRRAVYEQVFPIDEQLFAIAWDQEFSIKAQLMGFGLHFEPDAVVQYRHRHDVTAAYRQAVNYGRDWPVLAWKYLRDPSPLQRRHYAVQILRALPTGIRLWLMSMFNLGGSRGGLVRWVWGLGISVGALRTVIQRRSTLRGRIRPLPWRASRPL